MKIIEKVIKEYALHFTKKKVSSFGGNGFRYILNTNTSSKVGWHIEINVWPFADEAWIGLVYTKGWSSKRAKAKSIPLDELGEVVEEFVMDLLEKKMPVNMPQGNLVKLRYSLN